METNTNKEEYTIDLMHIVRTLLQRIWIIILACVIAGATGFVLSAFVIEPSYSSTVKFYVNSTTTENNGNITSSQIDASTKLVKTYQEILHSNPTYERIITSSGVSYTKNEIANMIKSGSSNGTEVMYVTVTSNDPHEAAQIAQSITKVLPSRISQVIKGSTVAIVEDAAPNLDRVSPSITKYTAIGILLGAFVSIFAVAIMAIMDNKIHSEDYIIQNYGYPILTKIPSLSDRTNSKKGYYKYYKENSGNSNNG